MTDRYLPVPVWNNRLGQLLSVCPVGIPIICLLHKK
jgi:hypothetical protein